MGRCSIDFHVLSSLWILKVGERLERRLDSSAMGSRLRRTRSGDFNELASGSFKPYLYPYREWRDGGLTAMTRALDDRKSVIALTADVTSYYHCLNPEFLLDKYFLHGVLGGADLDTQETKLHRLFVKSLVWWSHNVAERTGWRPPRGLPPVGLPASAVVANLALIQLDEVISDEVKPLYYGRYVDDILLVLEDSGNLQGRRDVWDWIIARSRGFLQREEQSNSDNSYPSNTTIEFSPSYLSGSTIRFDNHKNKVFHLSGSTGRSLLGSIKKAINERGGSEWRALPAIPSDPTDIGSDIANATHIDGDPAETLRDTDEISARRSGFAIRLRDFEAYERNLNPESWQAHRSAFIETVCQQILVMPHFFDLAPYVPRLVKLAVACGDYEATMKLIVAVRDVHRVAVETCRLSVVGDSTEGDAQVDVSAIWGRQLCREIYESIASGLASSFTQDHIDNLIFEIQDLGQVLPDGMGGAEVRSWHSRSLPAI